MHTSNLNHLLGEPCALAKFKQLTNHKAFATAKKAGIEEYLQSQGIAISRTYIRGVDPRISGNTPIYGKPDMIIADAIRAEGCIAAIAEQRVTVKRKVMKVSDFFTKKQPPRETPTLDKVLETQI